MEKKFVFLGDSQTCRLLKAFPVDKSINLAESGAPVARALQILREFLGNVPKEFTLTLILFVLVGTNNCKRESFDRESFKKITVIGRKLFKEVVLFKVPPIPKLQNFAYVSGVNKFVNSFHSVHNIIILDSFSPFILNDQINLSLFELVYRKSKRSDLIHLNRHGLRILFALTQPFLL